MMITKIIIMILMMITIVMTNRMIILLIFKSTFRLSFYSSIPVVSDVTVRGSSPATYLEPRLDPGRSASRLNLRERVRYIAKVRRVQGKYEFFPLTDFKSSWRVPTTNVFLIFTLPLVSLSLNFQGSLTLSTNIETSRPGIVE